MEEKLIANLKDSSMILLPFLVEHLRPRNDAGKPLLDFSEDGVEDPLEAMKDRQTKDGQNEECGVCVKRQWKILAVEELLQIFFLCTSSQPLLVVFDDRLESPELKLSVSSCV